MLKQSAILFIMVWLFILPLSAQTNRRGIPFIKNYSPKEYQANEQNWAIVEDSRGLIYVGNQENGVLEFDGVNWRKIPLPNNPCVWSLASDSKGNIYVGSVNEFGLLQPDSLGFMQYKSLSYLIDSTEANFGDVLRTYTHKDVVYFTTRAKVFKYEDKMFEIYSLPENTIFTFLVKGKLYCSSVTSGLHVFNFKKNEFQLTPGGEFYKGLAIGSILPYDSSGLIIGAHAKGSYLYNEKEKNNPLPNPSLENPFLVNNGIYHGTQIQNNRFGYATVYKGVSILDKKGNLLYHLNKENGLRETSATYTYCNQKVSGSPLWATLTIGISKIEINSPVNYFDAISGINDIISFDKKLYLANDVGIFCLNTDGYGMPTFTKVEKYTGNAWQFLVKNNETNKKELLIATSGGIYTLNNNYLHEIIDVENCRVIFKSTFYKNHFYIGTTEGLASISFKNNQWSKPKFYKNIKSQVLSINEDKNGNLWLGTYLNGVVKFNIDDSSLIEFKTKNGLPSLKSIRIENINNELVFATEKGLYKFDKEKELFYPYSTLNIGLSNGSKGVLKLYQDAFGKIWLITLFNNKNWIEVLEKEDSTNYVLKNKPYRRIPHMTFQSIYTDPENITWIGGSEGLFSIDNSINRSYKQKYNTYIRKVILGQDSVIFGGTHFKIVNSEPQIISKQYLSKIPEIIYANNSLSFEFASPFFENSEAIKYSWQLQGFDKRWNHWSIENKAFYTNLYEGAYTFKVKAINVYGVESEIDSFAFEILPPWYRTYWAFLLYVITLIILVRFIVKLYVKRLENEKNRLEGIVKERTAEIRNQKEKIEVAYNNVKMLSEIGQEVTANLSIERIVDIVYSNVNSLMEASVFAIGVLNEEEKVLDFYGKEEGVDELIKTSDPLENTKLLSVWCIKNQKEILIKNFSNENHQFEIYDTGHDFKQRESMIYLPLITKDKKIGILTVQSFKVNAFTDYHLNILKNLAVYTSIALDNAEAYEKIDSQNITLQQQKNEIEAQRDEIEAQRDYVTKQRDQIARQNKSITDSIQYAKRIQKAVLPPDEQFSKSLPDHFIFFKPRDIVSGDFYWMRQINEYVVITAADCTGHGVPGAFMSMLGVSFLNEIVGRNDITQANQVLNELRDYIKTSLRQTGKDGEAKDGMDMALCAINMNDYTLQYAGAYNPLYLFRNSELIEIKADKMPIGIHVIEKGSFTNNQIELEKGDVIYLFSDGFPDQFGGPDGQKFKAKRFKNLLSEIHTKPMTEQKIILETTLKNWQGENEQVDDITVLGIKI